MTTKPPIPAKRVKLPAPIERSRPGAIFQPQAKRNPQPSRHGRRR
ncbi:hypothetical protein [Falsiroseomonas sp.]